MTFMLFAAAFFIASIALFLPYVLLRLQQMKAGQLDCVSMFFDSAPRLIASEDIPAPLAEMLARMSNDMTNPRIVRHVLYMWLGGKLGERSKIAGQNSFSQLVKDLPEPISKDFDRTVAVGLLALTYAAPISGWILRRLLFLPAGIPVRTETAPVFAYQATHERCAA